MIQRRVFIVGCPRSGSTLLQSLLAAHPQIASFPETHFFREFHRRRRLTAVPIFWPRLQARDRLHELVAELGRPDMTDSVPRHAFALRAYVRAYYRLLDTLAIEQDASIWVEKTPDHLHFIPMIRRHTPLAFFVHIVRDGRDVVASLYDAAQQHGGIWTRYRDIDTAIGRWNRDILLTERYAGRANHFVVHYERLVQDTEASLYGLCTALSLGYDTRMVESFNRAAKQLIVPGEKWKEGAKSPVIYRSDHRKFERLFTREQREYIQTALIRTRVFECSKS